MVLPGVIIGSIIACYRFALADKRLPQSDINRLRSGAYNVFIDPGWCVSAISFSARSNVPEKVSIFPAPTPIKPGTACAGACGNIFARYIISTFDSKVTIRTQVTL